MFSQHAAGLACSGSTADVDYLQIFPDRAFVAVGEDRCTDLVELADLEDVVLIGC